MVLIGFPKVKSGKGYGKEGDKRDIHQSKREKGNPPTERMKRKPKKKIGTAYHIPPFCKMTMLIFADYQLYCTRVTKGYRSLNHEDVTFKLEAIPRPF